jgi:hypothetical protein
LPGTTPRKAVDTVLQVQHLPFLRHCLLTSGVPADKFRCMRYANLLCMLRMLAGILQVMRRRA